MFEFTVTNAIILSSLAVVGMMVGMYRLGEYRAALVLTPQICAREHIVPVVDPYAHIPVDWDWDERRLPLTPIGEGMETVIVLDAVAVATRMRNGVHDETVI